MGIWIVTEEIEAEVKGQEEEKLEQLEKWLRLPHHSKAIIMAMALRAALRTLPIINLGQDLPASRIALNYPKKVASAFRATAIAKIIAKFPDLALDLRGGILSAATDAKTPNIVFPGDPPINYFFAAMRAASLSALTSEKKFNQLGVYRASLLALSNPSFLATNVNFMFWNTIEEDVKLVNSGVTARQLVNTKLWHGAPPAEIMNQWEILCDGLPEEDNWSVWKRWYEENFYGIDLGSDHDLSFAICPEEKWHEGPAAANAWIAKRLAELDKDPPDHILESFEKLIAQDPHGAPIEIVDGKARIVASLDENDAKVAENPQTIQLHERVKIRASSARERVRRLANQPGFESISATVEEFYSYISGDTLSVAANISTVWELSVAIGSFIERDDEIRAGRGGMVSEMDADARETLDQLVIASAPFVRRFPTARQNDDDVRLFKQSRANFDSAKRIFEHAASENLIEDASKKTINTAINVADISSGIQSEKSRSWVVNTAQNLIRALLNNVKLIIVFGIPILASPVATDIYEHSQIKLIIREYALKKEDDIFKLFSDLPPDIRTALRESLHRLNKP